MSEEKPLDPTPMRVANARREGNVPRCSELVAAAAFGAAAAAACAVVVPIGQLARNALFAAARGGDAGSAEAEIIALALLPLGAGACCAFGTAVAQSGGLVLAPISVKAERLNPVEGAKRILSRETVLHALRGTLAFVAATAAIVPAIRGAIFTAANAGGVAGIAAAAWGGIRRELSVACAIGLLFAAAEYAVARSGWLRKLRMSFEELKREIKEQEGDPQIRGRRRTQHRDLSRGAISSVREAAFVVTNPTHVAIALAYRPPEIAVPVLLVCARDAVALRVRALAIAFNIPVVEDPVLARALLRSGRVGRPIAAEHYIAVAEIVVALSREGVLAP